MVPVVLSVLLSGCIGEMPVVGLDCARGKDRISGVLVASIGDGPFSIDYYTVRPDGEQNAVRCNHVIPAIWRLF